VATEPVKMALETAEGSEDEPPLDVAVITAVGDLVLEVSHGGETFLYRVSVASLTKTSSYFKNLLEGDFDEGIQVQRKLKTLDRNKIAELPYDALPLVKISDIGRISKVNTIRNLVEDFLNIVHGYALPKPPPVSNLANLANLAIVADRFDCLPSLIAADRRLKFIQANEKRTNSGPDSEERTRQKLLIGILLDHSPWISISSKRLIICGSTCWKVDAVDDPDAALWWDLPRGIEEELVCRRNYLLETLESLQSHFLKLYTSAERQCKFGYYEASLECDSFQLGQMLRFFQRINTLRLKGTLVAKRGTHAYSGDIERILDALYSCRTSQIYQHSHCGLRARLIPLLEALHPLIRQSQVTDLGICGDCWRLHRIDYAWTLAKRPVAWGGGKLGSLVALRRRGGPGSAACLASHARVRELCMATERDWTRPGSGEENEGE